MSDQVRIGVIGVGGMGNGHCKASEKVDEVQVTAVADIDEEAARSTGEEFGVPHFTTHQDLISSGLVDAVIIATPHYFHPPIAIDAFEAGLHVLSEKPIGVRIGEAERMVKAARNSGKVFSVMYQMRTLASVRKAGELVEAGELGQLQRTLLIAPSFRSQAYYDSGSWRATWAGEGGGVLLNQVPHPMDIFTMLGGMPSKVMGFCRTLLHDIEVEDDAYALLEYDNGASGYFYCSTCEVSPGRFIEIVGDKGRLQLLGGELRFWRCDPPASEFCRTSTEMWGGPSFEEVPIELEERENGHHVILRNFARAILYDEELIAPGEVGLKSLELSNAIILSSHKGEPVDVPIDRREYHELIDYLCQKSSYRPEEAKTKRVTDPNL